MPTLPFILPATDAPGVAPSAPPASGPDQVVSISSQPPLRLAQRDDAVGTTTAPTPRIAGLGSISTQSASPRLNVGPNRYT